MTFHYKLDCLNWQAFTAYSLKCSSLLQTFVNYGQKRFIAFSPGQVRENKEMLSSDPLSRNHAGHILGRERLITIDLLVLTSLVQPIILYLKYYFPLLQNKLPWWGGQLYWSFPFSKDSLTILCNFLPSNWIGKMGWSVCVMPPLIARRVTFILCGKKYQGWAKNLIDVVCPGNR